jgi:FixJ family two-component response regulator
MRFRVLSEQLHCYATKRHRCTSLDIRPPGMSGFELERHLASIGPPIGGVFVSARDGPDVRQKAAQESDRILCKAVGRLRVLEAVHTALGSRREQRSLSSRFAARTRPMR